MVDFQSRDTNRGRTASDGNDDDTAVTDDASAAAESIDDDTTTHEGTTQDGADGSTPTVSAAIVTVSDSRTLDDDPGGDAVADVFESAGHDVATREVLRTSHDSVQQAVDTLSKRDDVTAVVTVGGTGVAPRDVTIEAVHPLIDKGLPGFGELFRRRYVEAVGSDAIATRATAGIAETTPVFCLPADAEATRIGVSEIVVEQAERLSELATGEDAADS